jgi:hypothetical protein
MDRQIFGSGESNELIEIHLTLRKRGYKLIPSFQSIIILHLVDYINMVVGSHLTSIFGTIFILFLL